MLRLSLSAFLLLALFLQANVLAVDRSSDQTVLSLTDLSLSNAAPPPSKPDIRKVFKKDAKRMIGWGGKNGPNVGLMQDMFKRQGYKRVSSYHRWEYGAVGGMPAQVTFIPTYWGDQKSALWTDVMKFYQNKNPPPIIMSFNEPDNDKQAKMPDPEKAAQEFYDKIAKPFGKSSNIVAPAVARDVDGWLTRFMNRCNTLGCNIDAIGMHTYVGFDKDMNGAVAKVQKQVIDLNKKFGKPIIISEFGITKSGGGSYDEALKLAQIIGGWFDQTDYVVAWALNAGFPENNPFKDKDVHPAMAFFTSDGKSWKDLAYKYVFNAWPENKKAV